PQPLPVQPRFEDGFMLLLRQSKAGDKETGRQGEQQAQHFNRPSPSLPVSQSVPLSAQEPPVQVRDLVRPLGSFLAVHHAIFDVQRGEIVGLVGPNGGGKTTTFRMLCGLLPASSGTLRVAGVDLSRARASARQRIGYVVQKFSLYGQLSVTENLDFFASAYNL